jgi:hypothetical protein
VLSRDGYETNDEARVPIGDPVVEMQGVRIKYGSNSVLGDWQQDVDGTKKDGLWWDVRRGQRWGIFGANGKMNKQHSLRYYLLTRYRIWKDNTPVPNNLRPSPDILSPSSDLPTLAPANPWRPRDLYLRHPKPNGPLIS